MKRQIIFLNIFLLFCVTNLFTQQAEVKNSGGHILMKVNDEGDFGSITLPSPTSSTPSETASKLYNVGTTLYWNGSAVAMSGSPDGDWTISGSNIYSAVSGNVGIGESSPDRKLHIGNGMLRIDRDANSVGFLLHRYTGSTPLKTFLFGVNASGADNGYFFIGDNHTAVGGTPDTRLVIDNAGKVGIGTASPNSKLEVAGTIHATSGGFKFPDGTTQTTAASAGTPGWNLTGNSGTTAGTNFIGTTDNQALELKVNSARALRLVPHATSPNLIGGYSGNSVTGGIYGATIGGGGGSGNINSISGSYSTIAGGEGNVGSSDRVFIGGGQDNSATSSFTTVGGGWNNQATGAYNIVGGGSNNTAGGQYAFIGGGSQNTNSGTATSTAGGENNTINADYATVGGGSGNEVTADYGTIAGGSNKVTDQYGSIGGGGNNLAGNENGDQTDARYATVCGGYDNAARSYSTTIAGGSNNTAESDSGWATISGGRRNSATATYGTVCGGKRNTASGYGATVAGGRNNLADGSFSFAAGQRAKANHTGSFVWADYSGGDFTSTANNQFHIRAAGGMYVQGNNGAYGAYFNNESGGGDVIRAVADVSKGTIWGAVYATNSGTSPAVYASGSQAGYFSGNVTVTGTLSKGGGSFKIDHPLDPLNKYLNHSFVESPDMKNIYDGVVRLDGRGEAWVDLPEWFEPLNRDFRYQLTAIGAPGPKLFIAQKITNNRFKIGGGTPGMEVSWQVTGIRQDGFANVHRIQVEEDKIGEERGRYLHPEAYDMSETMGIDYEARLRKERQ